MVFIGGSTGAAAEVWTQSAHRPALGYPHAGQIVMRLPSTTSSLALWVMRNSLVPQRRNQVRYVTVTKMRGYSCIAEVPVVSVSAVVDDFPHGSSAISRPRPHVAIAHVPDSSQSGMTLADCHSRVFAGYHLDRTTLMFSGLLSTFRGSDTAGRTVRHEYIGTHCATTNFADSLYYDISEGVRLWYRRIQASIIIVRSQ